MDRSPAPPAIKTISKKNRILFTEDYTQPESKCQPYAQNNTVLHIVKVIN